MFTIETVTVPKEAAEEIMRFYQKCADADKFFEVCQAPSYKRFIQTAFQHDATRKAFEAVAQSLCETAVENETEKPAAESKAGRKKAASAAADLVKDDEKKGSDKDAKNQ